MKQREKDERQVYSNYLPEEIQKKKPKTNIVKYGQIDEIGPNGEIITRNVMLDDEGNILNDSDIDYETTEVVDEYGKKTITKRPYVKRDKYKHDEKP
jgi:hypothetical protein